MRVLSVILLAGVATTGTLPYAVESAAEPAPVTAGQKPSAAAVPPAPAKQPDATEAAAQSAEPGKKDPGTEKNTGTEKSSADKAASPQRFIPSEQVRADFDVSFPIDI